MSEEQKKPEAVKKDEVILGVPIAQVPPAPWTYKALGHAKYFALAIFGGYTDERNTSKPDIDPRTFAQGVAHKRIFNLLQFDLTRMTPSDRDQTLANILTGDFSELPAVCPSTEAQAEVRHVVGEAKKLGARLEEIFGERQGTARNAEAVLFAEQRKAKQV